MAQLDKREINAQGTMQYLVLIGIIIVVALGATAMLSGFFSSGSSASGTSAKIATQTKELAITEAVINADGNTFLRIKSNIARPVTITSVTANNGSSSPNTQLYLGQATNTTTTAGQGCSPGEKKSVTITINYTDEYGLIHNQRIENVLVDCANFSRTSALAPVTTQYSYTWRFANNDYTFDIDGNCSRNTDTNTIRLGNTTNTNYFFKNSNQLSNDQNRAYFSKQRTDDNSWVATGELDWNYLSCVQELIPACSLFDMNLNALYHLNSSCYDSSGFGRDGTCTSSNYVTGKVGSTGLSLVAAGGPNGQYLNAPATVGNTTEGSYSMWIYWTGSGRQGLMADAGSGTYYKIVFDNDTTLSVYGYPTGFTLSQTIDSSFKNSWRHIVVTLSNSGHFARLYIDGSLVKEQTGVTLQKTNTGGVSFGSDNIYGGATEMFTGRIDEIAVWNRVLSTAEVLSLYNQQVVDYNGLGVNNNIYAYFNFNKKIGSTIYDLAENNPVTLVNADTNSGGLWDGNALECNGVNGYLQSRKSMWLGNTNLVASITFWAKGTGYVITNERTSTSTGEGLVNINSNGTLTYRVDNFGGPPYYTYINSTIPADTSNWNYYAITFDGPNNNYYIFVNGQSETISQSFSNGAAAYYVVDICRYKNYTWGTGYFTGKLDEVKIYTRILSAAEIRADYNRFLSAKFVDSNIIDAGGSTTWNFVKVNSDLNYNFNRQMCGGSDSNCSVEKWNTGLVGLWHLNANGAILDMNDSSGSSNTGSCTNCPGVGAGLWDKNAGSFDGSDDYITISDNSSLDLASNATVSAWVKPSSFSTSPMIVAKQWCSGNQFSYYLGFDTSGNLVWAWDDDGSCAAIKGWYTSTTPISLNNWSHVAAVHTASSVQLYINGRAVSGTLSGAYSAIFNSNSPFNIGIYRNANGSYADAFSGQIDEVAVWNRALSESEISDLYRKGVSKLDLNIYACSDANCNTKTSSVYVADMNNNYSTSISSLGSSRYVGFDAYFKQAAGFADYNAGTFYKTAFLRDINIAYTNSTLKNSCYVDMNFQPKDYNANVYTDLNWHTFTPETTTYNGTPTFDYNLMFDSNGTWFNYSQLPIKSDYNIKIRAYINKVDATTSPDLNSITIQYAKTA